ncbi:probable G-protein coupled receptor 27 [Astyanax mexicanus]|uniref:probable G-protein coupled receptor 27 n=1 Tax=Astyanax mexicanus TaxID=7994 RepID=UPI0020CAED6F|nr:probable G-protein coupled receptor 27 [Astyanax mexicanus]
MANASDPGGPQDSVQLAALGAMLCASVAGNALLCALVLKDGSLHRAPYYLLLDLCAADAARAALGFPVAATVTATSTVAHGARMRPWVWPWAHAWCCAAAALAALFCFHVAFVLLGASLTRYLAIAHHRFYAKRVTPCACAMLVAAAWALSAAAALPPALEAGSGVFPSDPEHCALGHTPARPGDALGLVLTLAAVVVTTHAVYAKTLCFVYGHRKMKPAQPVPAVSHNWTFHGPGATGQAAANWIAGFGRGPTPPALVGVRQAPRDAGRRLLVLDEFKMEKRIGKMFYMLTLTFLLLWAPYVVACYARVFGDIPHVYLTVAVWLTFAQTAANPVICFAFNKELRVRLRACFPCCITSQTPMEPYCVI